MNKSLKLIISGVLAILVVIFIFIMIPANSPEKPLQSYLKKENNRLKKKNDSLSLIIKKNDFIFNEMSRTIVEMANQKREIKYVYNEKYKEIRFFTNSRIILEFDSIFSKSNIR
jgi:hypothetical protein